MTNMLALFTAILSAACCVWLLFSGPRFLRAALVQAMICSAMILLIVFVNLFKRYNQEGAAITFTLVCHVYLPVFYFAMGNAPAEMLVFFLLGSTMLCVLFQGLLRIALVASYLLVVLAAYVTDWQLVTRAPAALYFEYMSIFTFGSLCIILAILFILKTIYREEARVIRSEERNSILQWEHSLTVANERELLRKQELLDTAAGMSHLSYWEWRIPEDKLNMSYHVRIEYGYDQNELDTVGFSGTPAESGHVRWADTIHPDDMNRVREELENYLAGITVRYYCELRMKNKSGEYLWVASSGHITERDDKGNPVLMIGSLLNINDFRRAETSSSAKSSFLANMSHEIRTPLNVVLGITEMLQREDLPPAVRENLTVISQAGSSLLAIVNDILDISKIESGRMEIVVDEYNLESLINDVVSILRQRAMEKRLLFAVYIDSSLPRELSGDEIRIRQILINLLSNAIKYTRSGCVMLTVEGERRPDGMMNFIFAVSDTGMGIREDDIEKLFTDYYQTDIKKNRAIEGTGLGLPISQKLCALMGGKITVVSTYGKGSTFTAEIPQKIAKDIPFATLEPKEGRQVLVYGESSVNTDTIIRCLSDFGVPALLVSTRVEFLRELESGRWPFIFTARSLFEGVKEAIRRCPSKPDVTVFTGLGEEAVIGEEGIKLRNVMLPAYGNHIAAILDGRDDVGVEEHGASSTFTAPDARVLVVDDIASNITVVVGLISPFGMKVDRCLSGADAVKMVQRFDYDIVFMDHMMPGMDGIEATAEIRTWEQQTPGRKPLVIIALTANAMVGMKQMFLDSGFNDYLSKPIEVARLNEALWRWLPAEKKIMGEGRGT